MPAPPGNRRAAPITPSAGEVPVSFDASVPTSSRTGSFMCQTPAYPFASLNTAPPFDSLAASGLPQYSFSSCRSSPRITGTRTQIAASPFAASHVSI